VAARRNTIGVVCDELWFPQPPVVQRSKLTLSAERCGTKSAQLQMDNIVNESSLVPRVRRKPNKEDGPMVRVVGDIDGRSW
jgi:hypothetical protein